MNMKKTILTNRSISAALAVSILLSSGMGSNRITAEDKKHQHKAAQNEKQKSRPIQIGKADANAERLIVKLRGLVCDFCAQALEKVFRKRKEVSALSIDLKAKLLILHLKKGHNLSDESISKLIKDAGYNVVQIQRQKGKEGGKQRGKRKGKQEEKQGGKK